MLLIKEHSKSQKKIKSDGWFKRYVLAKGCFLIG